MSFREAVTTSSAPMIVLASPREEPTKSRRRGDRSRGTYSLPEELARHAPKRRFVPGELRSACREAGEQLGREDATEANFRTAAQMVEMWRGLDLPAWEAPNILRDRRLGYLKGYEQALVRGALSEVLIGCAAERRWGERWPERLEAVRERLG